MQPKPKGRGGNVMYDAENVFIVIFRHLRDGACLRLSNSPRKPPPNLHPADLLWAKRHFKRCEASFSCTNSDIVDYHTELLFSLSLLKYVEAKKQQKTYKKGDLLDVYTAFYIAYDAILIISFSFY